MPNGVSSEVFWWAAPVLGSPLCQMLPKAAFSCSLRSQVCPPVPQAGSACAFQGTGSSWGAHHGSPLAPVLCAGGSHRGPPVGAGAVHPPRTDAPASLAREVVPSAPLGCHRVSGCTSSCRACSWLFEFSTQVFWRSPESSPLSQSVSPLPAEVAVTCLLAVPLQLPLQGDVLPVCWAPGSSPGCRSASSSVLRWLPHEGPAPALWEGPAPAVQASRPSLLGECYE